MDKIYVMKKVLAPFLSLNTASAFLNVVVKRTFYVALFLCFVVNGFGQTVGWAVKGGGSGNDVGLGVAHDANGNVFVTGYFAGNASFGSTTLTSAGSNDIFLTKYNASGNVIWAKGFGSSGDDQGLAVSVTSTNEVVISGVFSNTVSFGTNSVSSSGSYDMFVCKLDNDGNALWTKKGGGTGGDYGWSVACNDAGSVFVGGSFASATASFGSTTLTSSGGTDVFVAEYDLNGNFVQAKNAGSSGEDLAYAIHTHGAHTCLYLAGRFSGTASFSGNTVVSSGAEDAFVAHFEMSTGVFDWVRKMGGSGSESAQGVSTDADCNVYVAGQYSNNCDFGGTVNTTAGDRDAFVAKWDELGNFVYVNTGGGSGYDYASGVDVDDLGNVYITGFISTTATFGSTSLTSNGAIDIFTARYKPDGSFDYATSFGGTGSEYGRTISADNAGNSFVTGPFAGTVNFGGTSLTSSGGQDVYLVKQKKRC